MATTTDPLSATPVRCPQPDCQALMVRVKSQAGTALVCSAPLDHPKTEMHGRSFPLPAGDLKDWLKRMAAEKKAIQVASLPEATCLDWIRRCGGGVDRFYYGLSPNKPGLWARVSLATGGESARLDGVRRVFVRDSLAEEVFLGAMNLKPSPEPEAPDDGAPDA